MTISQKQQIKQLREELNLSKKVLGDYHGIAYQTTILNENLTVEIQFLKSKNKLSNNIQLKNNFIIDNTKLSPNKVANMIIKHFKLKPIK